MGCFGAEVEGSNHPPLMLRPRLGFGVQASGLGFRVCGLLVYRNTLGIFSIRRGFNIREGIMVGACLEG